MKVYFFKAPWCSSCHAIEQHVPQNVIHVDCDEQQELALKYGVNGLPVFIAVNEDGSEIDRMSGTDMAKLNHWIDTLEAKRWQTQ